MSDLYWACPSNIGRINEDSLRLIFNLSRHKMNISKGCSDGGKKRVLHLLSCANESMEGSSLNFKAFHNFVLNVTSSLELAKSL